MKKTFKTFLAESQRLPHWPKTVEELEEAYTKVCINPDTGEVMMPIISETHRSNSIVFNDDLTVSLKYSGSERVQIEDWMLVDGYLPFPFKSVDLDIEVLRDCKLKSLQGLPQECKSISYGMFALDSSIKNLVGGPAKVSESFAIHECGVESLEGFPEMDDDCSIYLTTSSLKDFTKIPKVARSLSIGNSLHFTHEHFEFLPERAELIAFTGLKNLRSLHYLHKHVKSLKQLGIFNTKITSSILSLALINGLEQVDPEFFNPEDMSWRIEDIEDIVDKYVGTGEVFDFQEALEEAGHKELAKL